MSQSEKARLHAIVEGHVQGVGFRYFVQDTALALRLKGWVRNRWDGSVEVLAEGERANLEKLLAALHRGPRSAHVTRLIHEWQTPTDEFLSFSIRPTS